MHDDYHSPEKVRARQRARYVREHAHHPGAAAAVIRGGEDAPIGPTARTAVELAGEIFDSLPSDPDAEAAS